MWDYLYEIRDFLELGGPVLSFIIVVTALLWVLLIERLVFLGLIYRKVRASALSIWQQRVDRSHWFSHKLKQRIISLVSGQLNRNYSHIRALVGMAPLLGLLGTVTGMLEVFNVMAVTGTGNVRAMAAGVSKATVPTMAGMVTALTGLLMYTWLERWAEAEKRWLNEHMTMDAKQ